MFMNIYTKAIKTRKEYDEMMNNDYQEIAIPAAAAAGEEPLSLEAWKAANNDADWISLTDLFGTVEYEGKTYYLTTNAEATSQLLPDPIRDTHFHMVAQAVDADKNGCTIEWIFEKVEGWALDQYNYDDVNTVNYRQPGLKLINCHLI